MGTDNLKVSIITPSYNTGKFIEDTIVNIKSQTYQNIEHIVVDAQSTDETLSLLKKYNVRYVSEPDNGQADAINKGWNMSTGDIISYLNADDLLYYPTTIETVVTYFEEHPDVEMVYGDGILIYDTGSKMIHCGEFNLLNLVYCKNYILQPSVFLRRSVFEKIGGLDTNLNLAMDLDYWIRIGMNCNVKYIFKVLSKSRIYPDAKSVRMMTEYVKEYEYILNKVFNLDNVPEEIKQAKNNIYTYIYTKGGLDYLHKRKIKKGLHYLTKACKLDPYRCYKHTYDLIKKYRNDKNENY